MSDDAVILAYAVRWRHWNGGSDEDIFVAFGLTPFEYFRRVRRILTGPGRGDMDPVVVAELMDLCNRRTLSRVARAG